MDRNFVHYLIWFIPIRSLRDKLRWSIMREHLSTRNFCYWVNYLFYSKNVKNKKTFFITNDWAMDEKEFYKSGFYNLIKKYYINDLEVSYKADIEVFGPIGNRYFLEKSKAKIKIFYTGECVSNSAVDKSWSKYSDNCINDVDLSLSFDRLDENKCQNYVRFPVWIFYHFNGILDNKDYTKDDIKKVIDNINNAKSKKNKFASLVAGHDVSNIRAQMYDKILKIDNISCPGKLFHNDDTLKEDFNNNKIEYLI
ncbi:hypothetical protein [Brachyspira hampsonii]|uniref:hypothetical protein n=1 Tax=Brachyspira hampsonii TaxID=1287055 RepID=UPI000A890FAB|nr:hypothetical protein [Brachyspira hampsonii]